MDKLTGADFRSFAVVLAALIVVISGVLGIAKNWRDLRKPSNDVEKWRRETDTKLDRDNKRLNALEDGNKVLCQGMLAMLDHQISGNDVVKLRSARDGLQTYLINR